MKTALVLGAGGFIGSHMVTRLKNEGYYVRGVDLKYPEFSTTDADEFIILDLRKEINVELALSLERLNGSPIELNKSLTAFAERGTFDEVYQFAADMGGAGYIFTGEHDADVMHNSATINLHVANHSAKLGVGKVFYSSSACMYPQEIQNELDPDRHYDETIEAHRRGFRYGLAEDMAYPANPDSEYGWEKLFSERLYLSYARNYGLNVRIARFHNIYGPKGTYQGGKEKAPAATCRKVIEAKDYVEVWGDGEQTRSFLYIDDCIDAVRMLVQSDFQGPVNIGSEEMVSINDLTDMACVFARKDLMKVYLMHKPQGVRGRNSDNTLIREKLGWEPKYSLQDGMYETFKWIQTQMKDVN